MTARSGHALASASGTSIPIPARTADEVRRAIQSALPRGSAKVLAFTFRKSPRWVRDRVEGHAEMSRALELACVSLLPPTEQERVERIRLRSSRLALALIPEPTRLLPSPAAALGASLAHLARATEGAALASADGVVTRAHVETVAAEVRPAVALALDGLASLEAAAGERLLP